MKTETYWPQAETDNLLGADRILYRKVYSKGTPDSMNHHGKGDSSSNYWKKWRTLVEDKTRNRVRTNVK